MQRQSRLMEDEVALVGYLSVTVLGSFWETALIVEAGLISSYVPARV
jgi:hypothetical protein